MQEIRVWSLVQEDSTCCGATKPTGHNFCAHALEPTNHNYWDYMLQLPKPLHPRACALQQEKPPQWEACVAMKSLLLQLEKSLHAEQTPSAKKKNFFFLKRILERELHWGWREGKGREEEGYWERRIWRFAEGFPQVFHWVMVSTCMLRNHLRSWVKPCERVRETNHWGPHSIFGA